MFQGLAPRPPPAEGPELDADSPSRPLEPSHGHILISLGVNVFLAPTSPRADGILTAPVARPYAFRRGLRGGRSTAEVGRAFSPWRVKLPDLNASAVGAITPVLATSMDRRVRIAPYADLVSDRVGGLVSRLDAPERVGSMDLMIVGILPEARPEPATASTACGVPDRALARLAGSLGVGTSDRATAPALTRRAVPASWRPPVQRQGDRPGPRGLPSTPDARRTIPGDSPHALRPSRGPDDASDPQKPRNRFKKQDFLCKVLSPSGWSVKI